MGHFAFRLQRVLGVRESFEQQRARELAGATAENAAANDAHAAAEARLDARRGASSLPAGERLPAGMLRNLTLTVSAAREEADAAESAREATAEAVARSRERYAGARRDRRVLERLREARLHTWTEDESRRDRRAMDDIAQVQRRHTRAA